MSAQAKPDQTALAQALALPAAAHIGQRIAKRVLAEQIASLPGTTAADKRLATDLLAELHWLAALKPTTCGLAVWQTETHDYLEIAVLHAVVHAQIRPSSGRKASSRSPATATQTSKSQSRLIELIHRAIPYPVVLIISQSGAEGEAESDTEGGKCAAQLSLAHKRLSQSASSAVVLEHIVTTKSIALHADSTPAICQFLQYIAFNSAAGTSINTAVSTLRDLYARYSDWLHAVEALAASEHTGQFQVSASESQAKSRRQALANFEKINQQLISLRNQASKESQLGSRAALNQQIAALMAQRLALQSKL